MSCLKGSKELLHWVGVFVVVVFVRVCLFFVVVFFFGGGGGVKGARGA